MTSNYCITAVFLCVQRKAKVLAVGVSPIYLEQIATYRGVRDGQISGASRRTNKISG